MKDHNKLKNTSGCFVTTIEKELVPKLRHDLEERGFSFSKPPHTQFQAKKETLSCSLYESGKLTVQGKGKEDFIEFILTPYLQADEDFIPHIGSDEAGKGDFLGPLCIAAVFVDDATAYSLRELGVKDSKDLSDSRVLSLAKIIENQTLNHVICLFPETYNRLYKRFANLNRLMAWAHFEALSKVAAKSGCRKALVDQFAHESLIDRVASFKESNLIIEQRTKAESDIAVAAASILARATFLEGLKKLEEEMGLPLPKGASAAVSKAALRIVRERGIEALDKVCKTHFKTYQTIVAEL